MGFARKVWKLLVAIKDGLVLVFMLLFFAALYAILSMRPEGRVRDGALLLKLDGVIVEEAKPLSPLSFLSVAAPTDQFQARDVVRALDLAAKDDRVKVVVLDLSRFLGGGLVHLEEIGRAIDEVRHAGKPVMTYANFYADDGVALAAHASQVWVDPMGGAFVAGPGGEHLYFKGLFDKFKVKAHIYRVGEYKSAVEPYSRSDMSPQARSAATELYDAMWAAYKADVGKARPQVRLDSIAHDPVAWLKAGGGNIAEAAKKAGLVDRIGSKTQFDMAVAKVAGEGAQIDGDGANYAHTPLNAYLLANREKTDGQAIDVVTIAGEIVDGDGKAGSAEGERIARILDTALKDKPKALVVRIDSPGGSVMASERIRLALMRWKDAKIPIVVSMANLAASGGYWVSTPASRVFAEPGTITGSIGVFALATTFEDTLAQYGVTSDGVRTGPLSGQPDPIGGFTPEVSEIFQTSTDAMYQRFISLVGAARHKTPQQVDAIGQGHVWDGIKARELGLVDQIGGIDAALAYAAKLGGVGNGAWHANYLKDSREGFSGFLASLGRDHARIEANATPYDLAAMLSARRDAQLANALDQVRSIFSVRGAQAYCLECPGLPTVVPAPDATGKGWLAALAQLSGTGAK